MSLDALLTLGADVAVLVRLGARVRDLGAHGRGLPRIVSVDL